MEEVLTREKFLEEGKKAFLERGFQNTSLRQLCAMLGLTLGAFYGCFKSKEDLFDAIVAEPAANLLDYYRKSHENYTKQDPKAQHDHLGEASADALRTMVDYMYEHYEVFKLLFCRSFGTKYESYLEQFIAIEVESTKIFLDTMKENHFFFVEIDEQLSHNLSSMLFKGLIEIFEHDMSYEHAADYVHKLMLFYTAGWMKLFEG